MLSWTALIRCDFKGQESIIQSTFTYLLIIVYSLYTSNIGAAMDVEAGDTYGFDTLFNELNVPHILENIFFSLDYDSFKACQKVNSVWKQCLSSDKYQSKSKEMLMEKEKNEENLSRNCES